MDSMDVSTQSFDEGKFVWYTIKDKPFVFLKGRVKKVDRMYQTVVITPDNKDKKEEVAQEISLPVANLQPASTEFQYTYLLSNLRLVNNPELIHYFRWVVSTGVQYSYMNRSLFFLNTDNNVSNRIDIALCNNIIEEDSFDVMEKDPHMAAFLSKILYSIKSEKSSKMLFLLGKKHSAKSVHFGFTLEYLEKVALIDKTTLKNKLKAFMTIIRAFTNNVNRDGHQESFAFAIYKFFFDNSMKMVGYNYKLISLFITFMAYEKQISMLPSIFYLTKPYFDSKKISYPHLDTLYKQDPLIGSDGKAKFSQFESDLFEAFKVI